MNIRHIQHNIRHIRNALTGAELTVIVNDDASVRDILSALQIQHGISNVQLSLHDRALQPFDILPPDTTLTMVPCMATGMNLPFDLDCINEALSANYIHPSMPANMQEALRRLNCDVCSFFLTLKEGISPPVLQLRVRVELMDSMAQQAPSRIQQPTAAAAEFVRETIQKTDSVSDRIFKDAIRRTNIQLPENSTEIIEKLASNLPLTDDEQETMDRFNDALLTENDRRELNRLECEHQQEASDHQDRMAAIRARMAATAARKSKN